MDRATRLTANSRMAFTHLHRRHTSDRLRALHSTSVLPVMVTARRLRNIKGRQFMDHHRHDLLLCRNIRQSALRCRTACRLRMAYIPRCTRLLFMDRPLLHLTTILNIRHGLQSHLTLIRNWRQLDSHCTAILQQDLAAPRC